LTMCLCTNPDLDGYRAPRMNYHLSELRNLDALSLSRKLPPVIQALDVAVIDLPCRKLGRTVWTHVA
jgi:hypothetical protein